MRIATALSGATLLLSSAAMAQLPNYPDFSSIDGLNIVGLSSFQNGNELRLTSAFESELAQVWFEDKVPVSGAWSTDFAFRIDNAGGVVDFYGFFGADGIAFVIQNADANAQGEGGSGMGYATIPNSLAVELDTWGHPYFGDPDSNHVSVQTLLDQPNSFQPTASLGLNGTIPELTSGLIMRCRIEYVPGEMKVYVEDLNNPALTVQVDLEDLGLDNGKAWIGFTSSTGGAFESHDLISWTMEAGGCYADCDGNQTLDVFDFLCFQDAFVQGDPYADCDGNTVLDVFDFLCFQDAFVVGCP
jgi:hypothetical protein